MVVDSEPANRRGPLDVEMMGVSLSPLRAGHEVPESATLLPVVLADELALFGLVTPSRRT